MSESAEARIERDQKRAVAIKRVLEEPVFQEVLEETRKSIIKTWENSRNVNERETAHATLTGMNRLVLALTAVVSSGEHVRVEMARPRRNPA